MNEKEIIESLKRDFPKLFCDPRNETQWYLPVGWEKIVRNLSADLMEIINSYPESAVDISCSTVKEKFGSLRFYISYFGHCEQEISAKIEDKIYTAEQLTSKACEVCGEIGTKQAIGSYIRTLCAPDTADLKNRLVLGKKRK